MVAHPAVVAAFAAVSVALISWKIYEEYQERKMYEQYQRHRARYEQEFSYEQQFNRFHRNNNDFDFDDDHEESSSSQIRHRKPFSDTTDTENKKSPPVVEEDYDQYELSDLEATIAERKRRLMAEQAFLDQEEENLRNRRNMIMRNSADVIPLSNSSSISSSSSSSSSSNSDSENNSRNLQSHMANFDPFVDQFQENASEVSNIASTKNNNTTENSIHEENNSDSTETIQAKNNQSQSSLNNSTELYYPSASLLSPTVSATTSVSGENLNSNVNRISDSEESWDAVSELEWDAPSSANESDDEFRSHISSAASLWDDDA
ncbi:hypothetical protein BD770DRAFT_403428 [Pilaira anomala]|nr:hypothetical protein BD770DRAFT_403428 [Pilaira anomala]